jgi:hypothetical protein
MRRRASLALVCITMLAQAGTAPAHSRGADCQAHTDAVLALNSPVDGILPVGGSRAVLLTGDRPNNTRFLGHDRLLIVDTRELQILSSIRLPSYTTPPGLAEEGNDGKAIVILDDRLLLLDTAYARVARQWTLDMEAVGWPAAVATSGRRIFLVGQPRSSSGVAARLEALRIDGGGSLRVLWREALGLTHAGVWLGVAGRNALVTYFPDAYDLHGWVAVRNDGDGGLRASYPALSPVVAASASLHRLYLGATDHVQTVDLRRGTVAAWQTGSTPIAIDETRRLVMFVRHGGVVIASGTNLQPLDTIPLGGARALGVSKDGATLLVGLPSGLARVNLGSCRSQ